MAGKMGNLDSGGYLARRGVEGPWRLDTGGRGPFPGGIIIPSFAEEQQLPHVLSSLAADPTLPGSGWAVVVVVNHRGEATEAEKGDNRRSLALLAEAAPGLPFPLLVVDAASPGRELPAKDGGVGFARKLGHDLLFPHLDPAVATPVLVSLDADTLVSPGYAGALCRHFETAKEGGAVIPFAHTRADDEGVNRAIVRYELFLRCYVAGLAYAGSPYGFHTVGSAMACTAQAYVKVGGMNRRRAGEDFYFLQELAKSVGVGPVAGACVHPSPRRSRRVPFGTGRAVGALLDGEPGAVGFHQAGAFLVLRNWLSLAESACCRADADLAPKGADLSPSLAQFLEQQGFPKAWERLLAQHRGPSRLRRAFHGWFDGFRTMKLLHLLADGVLPRREPEEVVASFPEAWGETDLGLEERLLWLRARQGRP